MEHQKQSASSLVRDIKRRTRRVFSAEEKIKIVLEGLRGEESVAALCRKYGIHENNYYNWSKEFLEAVGKSECVFVYLSTPQNCCTHVVPGNFIK